MKRFLFLTLSGVLLISLTACGGQGSYSIVGNWMPDDGTGTKVVASSGLCSGMFYSQGEPLDIGGPMTCSLGSKKNSQGRYSLVVSQPPNETTLQVAFSGKDEATVYDSHGNRLFSMTRQ